MRIIGFPVPAVQNWLVQIEISVVLLRFDDRFNVVYRITACLADLSVTLYKFLLHYSLSVPAVWQLACKVTEISVVLVKVSLCWQIWSYRITATGRLKCYMFLHYSFVCSAVLVTGLYRWLHQWCWLRFHLLRDLSRRESQPLGRLKRYSISSQGSSIVLSVPAVR